MIIFEQFPDAQDGGSQVSLAPLTHEVPIWNCLFFWCYLHMQHQCVCISDMCLHSGIWKWHLWHWHVLGIVSEILRESQSAVHFTRQPWTTWTGRCWIKGKESIPECTEVFCKDLNANTFLFLASQTNSLSWPSTEGLWLKMWRASPNGALPEGAEWLGRHFENQLGQQSKHASTVWASSVSTFEDGCRVLLPCASGIPACPSQPGASRPCPQIEGPVTCSSISNDVITWCLFQSSNFAYNVLSWDYVFWYIWYSIQCCFSICSPCRP